VSDPANERGITVAKPKEGALALQNKDTARLYRLTDKSASKRKERKTEGIRTRRTPSFKCG